MSVKGKRGRKPRSAVIVYEGRRYTWSVKGYWRCTTMDDRHNLARRIWEEHNGPIPAGHKIIYLDGDRFNLAPKNLACLSHSECQKRRLADPDYLAIDRCYLSYGRLLYAIKLRLNPEIARERGEKIWAARRRHYGPSGGNDKCRGKKRCAA